MGLNMLMYSMYTLLFSLFRFGHPFVRKIVNRR